MAELPSATVTVSPTGWVVLDEGLLRLRADHVSVVEAARGGAGLYAIRLRMLGGQDYARTVTAQVLDNILAVLGQTP